VVGVEHGNDGRHGRALALETAGAAGAARTARTAAFASRGPFTARRRAARDRVRCHPAQSPPRPRSRGPAQS
jgi:hypothetical protein